MLHLADGMPGCIDVAVGDALKVAQRSLDSAARLVRSDPDAALDDLLAARLLVSTAIVKMSPRAGV